MCLICKHLRRRSWTLDECVEALLHWWDEMDHDHRETVWVWLYEDALLDLRMDLIRKLLA